MGKNLVTSYAALGVGLAVVLTFGLTAISSVMEQPSQHEFVASQRETAKMAPLLPSVPEEEKPALESRFAAPPAEPSETQEDVSGQASAPTATGGATSGEAIIEKAPGRQEEMAKESYSIAAELPASTSPFVGLLVVLPYIAAAVAGSVVFIVTRKRVGW